MTSVAAMFPLVEDPDNLLPDGYSRNFLLRVNVQITALFESD
jgi:hypothetical protein